MAQKISKIYQFKITLKDIKPPIWRRIQVPEEYSFEDLHSAIQDAMGWYEVHPHKFQMINPKTGQEDLICKPDKNGYFDPIPEDEAKIAEYFLTPGNKAIYLYDFGDRWEHKVMLEIILPAVEGTDYPQCIAGERACPPEDCGGVWGYEELLEIIANPNHEDYEESREWFDDDFKEQLRLWLARFSWRFFWRGFSGRARSMFSELTPCQNGGK